MAALNANDPLSRLISADTVQFPELASASDGTTNEIKGDAGLDMDAVEEADCSATAHDDQDGIATLAGASLPARPPRRSGRPKRSAAHRPAAGLGQTSSKSATGYGNNVRGATTAVSTADPVDFDLEVVDRDAEIPAVSVTDEATRNAVLEELMPAFERARAFADRWEGPYQPEVFRVALGALLGHPTGLVGGSQPHRAITGKRSSEGAQASYPTTQQSGEGYAAGGLSPTAKLARILGVNAEDVERVVMFADDNRITIIGHAEGKTRKELQTKYGLAYCFIKEVALGYPLVDIEELRDLCVEHGCYDLANFTGNFRKDVKLGLLREIGAKGSRARQYRLARKGLEEAATLLREMVEQ